MDVLSPSRAALRRFVTPGPRMIDEGECALSVALAILLAHWIGAQNVAWAAFSGYMVMRGHVSESLLRGILRIVGTIVGAGSALLLAPRLLPSPLLVAAGGGLFAAASLYGAMTGKRAYAWLFVGLTFEMVLFDALEHPALSLSGFARTRLEEVTAGTLACLVVSVGSALTARRRWPAPPPQPARRVGWHSHAARHAAQAGAAIALLPILHQAFAMPQLAQSCVTIMATMLVPVSSIGASGFVPVSRRLIQRVAGCCAGAGLAAACLLLARGSPLVLIGGTMLGVVLGRHLENGATRIAYVGTQFVLAVLVTLVPDSYASAAIGPALDRLAGILIGMAVLEPVLATWHILAPRSGSSAPAVSTSMGE